MHYSPKKIQVEVWTDIVCPYCYIGKRNFEIALEEFPGAQQVDIRWKSFLLDPNSPPVTDHDLHQHLVESKGISPAEAHAMTEKVTTTARQAGLLFRLDSVKVANSRDAHRLLHFAETRAKAPQVLELLFKAYFSEGQNIASEQTLVSIARQAGLGKLQTIEMLHSKAFNKEVEKNLYEARLIDVRGVPFFLFNGEMAVPGALSPEHFKRVLERLT